MHSLSSDTPVLSSLHCPRDVAALGPEELAALAAELRGIIVDTVSSTGGHLASSLGVVELTLALLSEFDPSSDRIVWDVGHQTYAYKLLTGRRDRFHTLRTMGGLSGYPCLEESEFDHFGVGHSSTSISAALGMACARDIKGENNHVVAVIGDGSMTGGEAYEGLNQAGAAGKKLIVILNDNEMSISKNVGALSFFFSRNLSAPWVRRTKREIEGLLTSIPKFGQELKDLAVKGHHSLKGFLTPGMLFEAFRFNYIGPVNGHDPKELAKALQIAKQVDKPTLLHVLTVKGKGYTPAEENPTQFHGVGRFSLDTGICKHAAPESHPPTFTEVFGNTLADLASHNNAIIAITAAMPEGTGLAAFAEAFPERFVDVGICEQHAVTFAAGLAVSGLRPFVAIYSTFLQRSYDQIVHDVCLQNLPVTFCIDRAGIVGEDGATHQGLFDLAYLRHIPNMSILVPKDENELRFALATALEHNGPLAIRYPRGAGCGAPCTEELRALPQGVMECLREGCDAAVVGVGPVTLAAVKAAESIAEQTGKQVAVYNARWVKPLPEKELLELAGRVPFMLLVEEGVLAGGFGSAVLELFAEHDRLGNLVVRRLGTPDTFIEHGNAAHVRTKYKLDVNGVTEALQCHFSK